MTVSAVDDTVLDWFPTRPEAEEARDGHAATLRKMGVTGNHGVRVQPHQGGFRVVLVRRQ